MAKGRDNGIYRPEDHITVDDAAVKIGCSRMTVLRLIDGGVLGASRFTDRGWWHVSKESLTTYLVRLRAQERGNGKAARKVKR